MALKETTQKRCPHCSSLHVHDINSAGFSTSQYWHPPEERPENSDQLVYNCRNCGTRFHFSGY